MNKIIFEDIKEIAGSEIMWSLLYGKTILITGASGLLPAYMVETLLYINKGLDEKDRIKVIGLARNRSKSENRFSEYLNLPEFELIIQDVSDHIIINDKIDYIVHAASQASPVYYKSDPVGTLLPNVKGTINLLELAVRNSVSGFLFFSSGEVYGQVNDIQIPTKETDFGYIDPIDVRSCYSESKRMAETMCSSWFHQYGVPVKIVRPFHTYGPGMNLDDGRVFADFVSNVVKNENIAMKSDGTARRAFCYLSDATIGFFMVLLTGEHGEAYNIGSDKETSIKELAHIIANLFPEKHLKVIYNIINTNDNYLKSKISRNCPDIEKIRSLGWAPKYGIKEGFLKTIRSFYEYRED